jgi:hypothetical protein
MGNFLLPLIAACYCLLTVPTQPHVPDAPNGVFIAHHPPGLQFSNWGDWYDNYQNDHAITRWDQQHNRIDFDGNRNDSSLWYVIVAFEDTTSWYGAGFGLGDFDPEIYRFTSWGPTSAHRTRAQASHGWPAPNAGITITAEDEGWRGNYLPIYYFAGYAYQEGVIPLVSAPRIGKAVIRTHREPGISVVPEDMGSMGIFTDGKSVRPTTPLLNLVAIADSIQAVGKSVTDAGSSKGRTYRRPSRSSLVYPIPDAEYVVEQRALKQLGGNSILDLVIDRDGVLHILTRRKDHTADSNSRNRNDPQITALYRYDAVVDSLVLINDNLPMLLKVIFDKNNNLYGLHRHAVFKQSAGESTVSVVLDVSYHTNSGFRHMSKGVNGDIWVTGTRTGVFQIDSTGVSTRYTQDNSSLYSDEIKTLACSPNGDVWVIFNRDHKVGRFRNGVWSTYDVLTDLQRGERIATVACDESGRAWFGAQFRDDKPALYCVDGESWSSHTLSHLYSKRQNVLVRNIVPVGDVVWTNTTVGPG